RVPHSGESWDYLLTKDLFVDIRGSKQQLADFGNRLLCAHFEHVRHKSIAQTVRYHIYVGRTECGNIVKQLIECGLGKLSHLFVSKIAAGAPSRGPTKKQREPAEGQIMGELRGPQSDIGKRRIETVNE